MYHYHTEYVDCRCGHRLITDDLWLAEIRCPKCGRWINVESERKTYGKA